MTAINRYDEYGMPAAGNVGLFQYTGQMWLSRPGLYHYKLRAYAPHLGRFMQTDPVGYAGDSPNLYQYVLNDPVNFVDPLGLLVEEPPVRPDCIGNLCPSPGLHIVVCWCKVPTFMFWEGVNLNPPELSGGGGGGERGGGEGGGDKDRDKKKQDACAKALRERGEISVQSTSVSLIGGLGITVATGFWRNTTTGTWGQFKTFGFGAGLSAGATFTHQMYNNIQSFSGTSDALSVGFSIGYGSAGVGIGYSGSWGPSGSGGGWTFDIGHPNLPSISAAGTWSDTKIFNCQLGGR